MSLVSESELVEIQRCRHHDSASALVALLTEADIPFKRGTNASIVAASVVGEDSSGEIIISVKRLDYKRSRAVIEANSLDADIPENHYLLTSTSDELLDIVLHPDDWNAFDVAHARRLLEEQGVSVDGEKMEELALRNHALKTKGEGAAFYVFLLGWFTAFLIPIVGIFIGMHLARHRDKEAQGSYYTYKKSSRIQGGVITVVSITWLSFFLLSMVVTFSK